MIYKELRNWNIYQLGPTGLYCLLFHPWQRRTLSHAGTSGRMWEFIPGYEASMSGTVPPNVVNGLGCSEERDGAPILLIPSITTIAVCPPRRLQKKAPGGRLAAPALEVTVRQLFDRFWDGERIISCRSQRTLVQSHRGLCGFDVATARGTQHTSWNWRAGAPSGAFIRDLLVHWDRARWFASIIIQIPILALGVRVEVAPDLDWKVWVFLWDPSLRNCHRH